MRPPATWITQLRARVSPPGALALASFLICAISGALLLSVYRPDAPLDSLALALMKNPVGAWVRSVHYWSAQAFLVCATLYLVEQLLRRREETCRFGAWLRLVLIGPLAVLAVLSGLILRGDPAGERITGTLADLLQSVPPGGSLLAFLFFGAGHGLKILLWHHVLTLGLGSGLLLIVHLRRLLPGWRPLAGMALLILALSLLWVPGLQAYAAPAAAAPWFLVGLQTFLHRGLGSGLAAGLALCVLLALVALPALAAPLRRYVKWGLLAGLLVYAVSTFVVAIRSARAPTDGAVLGSIPVESDFVSARAYLPVPRALARTPVATVAGRPEGCLSCHRDMTGFSPTHNPAVIGCTACHRGNPFTLDATLAHAGMTLTPGNLSLVRLTCATANCHADIAARVNGTLMNTMSGVVAVDKVVFGESRNLNAHYVVARLDHSPADQHLRNLCASCHLGQDKLQPAPISQQGRGGGCSACHLEYDADARADLSRRGISSSVAPRHHPGVSLIVRADACFGCHSRSGRIATNYEGWQETELDPVAVRRVSGWEQRYRILDDGRVFTREPADVHFERGMICTDCHLPAEIMGDGKSHAHEGDEVKIRCTDCHADRTPPTVSFTRLDAETQKVAALRGLNRPGRRFLRTQSAGVDYPNVFLDDTGAVTVETVAGARLHPKPPLRVCGRDLAGHRMVDCRTCHSAWAPQCISCHTSFNPAAAGWDNLAGRAIRGAWQETGGDFRADPPTLGVETVRDAAGHAEDRIAPFVPGMILTLSQAPGGPHGGGHSRLGDREGQAPSGPSAPQQGEETQGPAAFHRLYAPASPHTIVTKARDCISCHANSLALGYGRGSLNYDIKRGRGYWRFTPALPRRPQDGLPMDAWIGFLEEPHTLAATRTNVRPLNRREQQRMLLVGACLQCHAASEPRVAAVFADFASYRSHLSPQCILPDWVH